MDKLEEIGERIKNKREGLKITQKQLSDIVSVSQESIGKFETGQRSPYEHLGAIAEALHTSRYFLLTGFDDDNAGIAAETGLSNEAISYLRQAKSRLKALWGYKETEPINALLGTEQGKRIIEEIWLYLHTDFTRFSVRTNKDADLEDVKELSIWVRSSEKDVYYMSTVPTEITSSALSQAFLDDITTKIKDWKEDIVAKNNNIAPRRGRKKKGVDNAPKE